MSHAGFQPPPVLDLRQGDPSATSTIVVVHADYRSHAWIHARDVELTGQSWSQGNPGSWTLEIRRHGATDCDHDAAVALRLGLVGVTFRMASGGRLWLDGFVAGDDPGLFRVPEPGWNQLEGAVKCTHKDCRAQGSGHVIVTDGRYIPPPNEALFERMRGLRIEIVTGCER